MAEVEHVDMNIGGSGSDASWGDMTQQQKDATVDQAYEAVRVSRHPESVPTAKDDETEDTTNKTPAGSDETSVADDAALAENKANGEGDDDEVDEKADWLDQDTRDLANTMGLTDEDLSEFGSRAELDRALRIIDRKAFEAGKAQQQPAKSIEKPSDQQVGQQKTEQQTDDPFADLTQYKLGDQFDEDASKPFNTFVDTAVATLRDLQNRLSRFEQQNQQRAVEEVRRQAIDSLHSLGNTELFGKPGQKPTKEQAANIEKAIDAHFTHARGLLATGRQAAPTPAFLKAAVHLAFGDQLSQQQQKQLTEKLRKQSSRRTGGAAAKPLPKVPSSDETPRQRAERLFADGLGDRFKELADQS